MTLDEWIEEAEREIYAINEGRKRDEVLDSADRVEVAQLRDAVQPEEDALAEQLVKELRAAK